jgi:hypothetical protein
MAKFIRHGDVCIVSVDSLTKDKRLKKKPDSVLMEGEATGHAHRIREGAEVWRNPNPTAQDQFFLGEMEVKAIGAALTHEEHHTIPLKKGIYRFYSQREFSPVEDVRVQD